VTILAVMMKEVVTLEGAFTAVIVVAHSLRIAHNARSISSMGMRWSSVGSASTETLLMKREDCCGYYNKL
jgi:hypothetical protein